MRNHPARPLGQNATPLREQIARLEEKIVILKRRMREDHLSTYQVSELQLDLTNAEEALKHFRRAYEVQTFGA